jgi:transposase
MTRAKTANDATGLDMDKFIGIAGYSDYKINRRGKILGKNGRPLKQQVNEKGYYYVSLYKDGKSKNFKVHRLVASSFLLKGARGRNCVNHVNGDKSNNTIQNLEWVTQRENIAKKTGERVSLTSKQRLQILKTLSRKYKTLTRKDVYDRLQAKYGVSRDYLSNLNYVASYKA